LGVPLKDMSRKLKEGILIAVVVRGSQVIIPNGFTALEAGDSVIVVARGGGEILDLNDIFTAGG
jgi:trk system potassium uptake protein TrkA